MSLPLPAEALGHFTACRLAVVRAARAVVDALRARLDQPRDEHGRYGSGGAGESEHPAEHVARASAERAEAAHHMEHEAHEAHEKASSALFAARQAHAAAAIREEEGVPGAEQEERAARRDVALKSRAEAKAARSLERAERATDHAVEEEATASEELPAERGPNHDADLAQARAKEAEWSQRLVTATARADTSAAMAKDSGRALSKIRATYDKGTAEDRDRIEAAEESHAEAEGRAESQDAWAARVDDIHAIWANRRETLDHRGTADR